MLCISDINILFNTEIEVLHIDGTYINDAWTGFTNHSKMEGCYYWWRSQHPTWLCSYGSIHSPKGIYQLFYGYSERQCYDQIIQELPEIKANVLTGVSLPGQRFLCNQGRSGCRDDTFLCEIPGRWRT